LNDFNPRTGLVRVFSPNSAAFGTNYVKVVEVRPILSVTKM